MGRTYEGYGQDPARVGHRPRGAYAEEMGDRQQLALEDDQVELVRRVAEQVDRVVRVVISGRPLVLTAVAEHVDAIVTAWWPGSEAAGIADVLVGARAWSGILPLDWPAEDRSPPDSPQSPTARWRRGHGLRPTSRSTG